MGGRPPLRVAIVGGGIAGLALAASLDPNTSTTTVHEAEPDRSGIGGGIVLWPDALRALARLGLQPTLEACSEPVVGGAVRDLTGRPLVRMPDAGMRLLTRPDLLGALETAVPDAVRHITQEVSDPRMLDADLVIGADGVRSRVRALVWPRGAERAATPWVALRGIAQEAVAAGEVGEYWGDGVLFGVMRLGPEQTYWFTSHRSALGPEPLDTETVVAQVRPQVARSSAAPALRRLLDTVDESTLATRLWAAAPLPRYVRGRYVVLGDAAHAMTPNLGRGACEAILDAVALGAALNTAGCRQDAATVGRVLRAWQLRRLPSTQAVRLASGAVMRVALAASWQHPRDRLLRFAGRT